MARILYVYSQESDLDSQMCQELEGWLYTLYRQNNHTTQWHMVIPGNDFNAERRGHFLKADIILLLISVDFLRSEQCYNELTESMKQCQRGAMVVPILLRPVGDLSTLPFCSLQPLPRNRKPVSKWKDKDSCWQQISQEIRKILLTLPETQSEATLVGLKEEPSDESELQYANVNTAQTSEIGIVHNVGSYKIERLIATGGTSTIYEATHEVIKKRIAIKIAKLGAEYRRSMELLDAVFLLEAKATALVAHPSVVEIFDFGRLSDRKPYILMEYLVGETLAARLQKTKFDVRAALSIIWQISATMAVAHRQGVVHGDLKPDNIMIVADELAESHERLKIIDFGIGRICGEPSPLWDNRDEFFGTPSYAAPEIFDTMDPISEKSDVYTLGSGFYQLLTGRPPYIREEFAKLVLQKMKEDPLDIRKLSPNIPKPVAELVHKMLARKPEQRPTMEEIKQETASLRVGLGEEQ